MKTLSDPCCARCTHSPATPCRDFIACRQGDPLCHDDEACRQALGSLRESLRWENTRVPLLVLGMGTCGLAAGAQKVREALVNELAQRGVEARLVGTACIGLCQREVLVDVIKPGLPRVCYGDFTPTRVPDLVERAIVGDEVIADWAIGKVPSDPFAPRRTQATGNAGVDALPWLYELPSRAKQMTSAMGFCGYINPDSIDEYIVHGGYAGLARALAVGDPQLVLDEVKTSGLRGRGGAGFPTFRKWELARLAPGEEKYVICNGDEGDPGAYMDRAVLEGDPHRVLEGLILAGYAIGACRGFFYVRAEYPLAVQRISRAIEQARAYGLLGENILGSGFSFDVEVRKGAGAFVCGEETALIASLEGRRGTPRPRPPFPAVKGFRDRSSTINNVETLANVPRVVSHGGGWLGAVGTARSKGTKVFAVTGKVRNTGLIEVPMGTTIREVIFDICGGMQEGRRFKAVQIGGPSGGCLPEQMLDLPIEYEGLTQAGAMMGSGGLVVLDDTTCMVDLARFFLTFTASESCGKCTPCREGIRRMLEILERISHGYWQEDGRQTLQRFQSVLELERLARVIKDTALCGLGQTAPNPVLTTLRYFRDEYEAHVFERRCPAGVCQGLLHYRIDPARCTGCTLCQKACGESAIIGEKKMTHYIVEERCVRCGTCALTCRLGAVVAS